MIDPAILWTADLPGDIASMAWSEDGRLAVSADDNLLLFGADGAVRWKVDGAGTRCRSLDWSPDGAHVAGAGYGIRIFSAENGEIVRDTAPNYEHRAVWSRCGGWLFTGTAGAAYGKHRTVHCRRAADLEVAWSTKLSGGSYGVEALCVLGDGAELLATDVDANGKIIVIDARTGKKLRTVRCLGACCRIVAAPDGRRFMYTGFSSPYAHHLDRSPRSQPLPAYQHGAGRLSDLAASPSPDTFAACGELASAGVVTWLLRFVDGAWSSVRIGEHPAQRVAWSADGNVLVLAQEKRLTALDARGLIVGAAVARPPATALDIEVPDPAAKARKAKSAGATRDKAAAELVGLFGNVMIAPEERKEAEASVFNAKCDAWFARHPGESIASVAMLIAGTLAANNAGVTRDAVYPMVLADLVRVRGGAG